MRVLIKILIAIIVIILGILALVFSFGIKSGNNKSLNDEKYKEISWMNLGKEAVKKRLKDGSSAEFRNVFFKNNGVPITCGEVNAKNSFGGYGGYQRFISAGNDELTFIEEQVSDFEISWNRFCK